MAYAVSYEIGISNRIVKYKSNTVNGAQISAVSQDHDKTWNFDFDQGRYFTTLESRSGSPVAVIGYDIAQDLFPGGGATGKVLKIMGRNVTVIGVFKKEGSDILDNSDDKIILLPLNFAKNVLDVQNDSSPAANSCKGKKRC